VAATYGPVTVKASQAVTDYFGIANSRGTRYYQADVAYPIAQNGLCQHMLDRPQ